MGLLSLGTPLTWNEVQKVRDNIKRHGIRQFINRYRSVKDVIGNSTQWGDEIECILVKFDHQNKQVKALLRADEILNQISQNPSLVLESWHPEYACFMIEGVPTSPYDGLLDCVSNVEANFRRRRQEIQNLLDNDEAIISIGNFPLTGCLDFSFPSHEPPNPLSSLSKSIFIPDKVIFLNHPHFPIVTRNITDRRGSKPYVNIPIFRDENTPTPFVDDFDGRCCTEVDIKNRKQDHIYLDSLPFGPSCCCLQMTFQTETLNDAKKLWDQFIPLSPIILALTASTPIFRGYLADVDCRWDVLKYCLDDRTDQERSKECLDQEQCLIPIPRCGSVDMYLLPENNQFNDFPIPFCKEAYTEFLKADIDDLLAESTAHLFIRDPVQIYKERLGRNDEETSELFEDIHLFHWRTVRLKLPPKDKSSGWKVEFRPSEVQMTDFQNAAFTVFMFLMSRLILEDKINMAMPIKKVIKNMQTAQKRDAVLNENFWFPTHITPGNINDCTQHTIDEIINGSQSTGFVGVASIIADWLNAQKELTEIERQRIKSYVDFVCKRANGQEKTVAKWMRQFVTQHPEYKTDSVVSQIIAYDLLMKIHQISSK